MHKEVDDGGGEEVNIFERSRVGVNTLCQRYYSKEMPCGANCKMENNTRLCIILLLGNLLVSSSEDRLHVE